MPIKTVKTAKGLRAAIAAWRSKGLKIGLVPTMGALHAGHLSLVTGILEVTDRAVVSIFVNPAQFGDGEDFDSYPRQQTRDLERLANAGAHLVYLPSVAEVYPDGSKTLTANPALSAVLCGRFRPGHFDGVATVVARLFLQILPDAAIFGEKDYQQLQVIRRMAADLDSPVTVMAAPTVREADGLAMSSRNAYLNAAERKIAATLPALLNNLLEKARAGGDLRQLENKAEAALIRGGFDKVDYIEFRQAGDLALTRTAGKNTRLFAAAWIAGTRLIDNIPLKKP